MQLPSLRASRRVAFLSAALAGLGLTRRTSATQAPAHYPARELLAMLPKLRDDLSIRVWRMTFKPGQSQDGRFLSTSSIMVESGTLTLPLTLEKTMKMMSGGPTLPYLNDQGKPVSSWTSGPVQPPIFPQYTGVISEDGNFGEIQNNGDDDLVLIIVESYTH